MNYQLRMQMVIQENVTLQQVKDFKPKMIFYGANTCWWTHDPDHLRVTSAAARSSGRELIQSTGGRTISPGSIPTDPVGGVLFETDDIAGFFKAAEENEQHYGKHGLRAFMAAHHSNCFAAPDDPIERGNMLAMYKMPHWASQTWDDYNAALDRLDAETGQDLKTGSRNLY